MFQLNGKNMYPVLFIKGGQTTTGASYTFITVQEELKEGQQFPEKLNIKVWGGNLQHKSSRGSGIRIAGCSEVGLISTQDKNDKKKWYKNLSISCRPGDILIGDAALQEEVIDIEPIEDLPF